MIDRSNEVYAELIDVTLRDGGYLNQHEFAADDIDGIAGGISAARIRYAEIGYYRPSYGPHALAAPARCDAQYLHRLRRHLPEAKLVCMVHPSQVPAESLDELADQGADVVRLAVTPKTLVGARAHVQAARAAGLIGSVNLIRASELPVQSILDTAAQAEDAGAHWFYVADSNSGMHPDGVARIFDALRARSTLRIGFHAHNALQLALANSLSAIRSGATLIDGSLGGMGKGGGNLPTELTAAVLNAMGVTEYRLGPLAAVVERHIRKWTSGVSAYERSISALLNLNLEQYEAFERESRATHQPLLSLLEEALRTGDRDRAAPGIKTATL